MIDISLAFLADFHLVKQLAQARGDHNSVGKLKSCFPDLTDSKTIEKLEAYCLTRDFIRKLATNDELKFLLEKLDDVEKQVAHYVMILKRKSQDSLSMNEHF